MLKITVTYTRPSTSVAWFTMDANDKAYYDAKAAAGLWPIRTVTESADGLTSTTVSEFTSKNIHNGFLADATMIAMKEKRLLYCVANNITIDYAGELIHDENDPIPQ